MVAKPEALLHKLENALTAVPVNLEDADAIVTQLRQAMPPSNPAAIEARGDLAVRLAGAFFVAEEYTRAEAWALRALQTRPRPDALCLLGELAYLSDDIEGALAWFSAAETIARPWEDRAVHAFWESASRRIERLRVQHFTALTQRRTAYERQLVHGLVVMTMVPTKARGVARETLSATIKSLEENDPWTAGPRTLVIDGELRQVPPFFTDWGIRPTASPRNEGQARTLFRVLELAHREKWDCVTILEDDVLLAPHALTAMQTMAIPKQAAVLAWYSNAPMPFASIGNRPRYVFQQMPCAATGVAITLPRRTIDAVLSSTAYQAWTDLHGGDGIFSQVLPGRYWATVYPNPVQHMGVESFTGNTATGPRLSPSFEHCIDATRLFDR